MGSAAPIFCQSRRLFPGKFSSTRTNLEFRPLRGVRRRLLLLAIAVCVSVGCRADGAAKATTSEDDPTSTSLPTDEGEGTTSPRSETGADAGETTVRIGTGETHPPVRCDTGADFIADYLDQHPLAPGEWSAAIEGMEGLNTWQDPDARTGSLRANGKPIVGDIVTTGEHGFRVGDTVLVLGTSLDGQLPTIVSTTDTTITLSARADEPEQGDIIVFPDYYTRSTPVEDAAGGGYFEWSTQFHYDSKTGLHAVGGGVGTPRSHIDAKYKTWRVRYDPCENRWYKIWNPPGLGTGHRDPASAIDPAGRRYFRGTTIFDLDDDSIDGVAIPDTPDDGGTANTVCYHEGRRRLYRITSDGRVRYWSRAEGWSERVDVPGIGGDPISAYLSGAQTLVFGGGDSPANRIYKVDSAGEITAIDDIPDELFPVRPVATMILDVGFDDRLIVMRDRYENGLGHPTREIWWLMPNAPTGDQWRRSPDVIPARVASYRGGQRTLAATAIRQLGVVLVIRHWPAGTLDAGDPAQRRAAAWLYRPSN